MPYNRYLKIKAFEVVKRIPDKHNPFISMQQALAGISDEIEELSNTIDIIGFEIIEVNEEQELC